MPVKFYDIGGRATADAALEAEYRAARAIGSVRVGKAHLFYRVGLRVCAAGWGEVRRCYRRVKRVPMKMCCGSGNMDVEYLVVEGDAGELAQVQLPDTRAAKALMEAIQSTAPGVALVPPRAAGSEARA